MASVTPIQKRPASEATASQSKLSRNEDISIKLSEVDDIVADLKMKHNGTADYTIEQLRTWGHLIQMGKHSSTLIPPEKP